MKNDRSKRIIDELKKAYPNSKCYDLDGRGMHFLSEIDPTDNHPGYDRAMEVIIQSKPHYHKKMTQKYTIKSGHLRLHKDNKTYDLKPGDTHTIYPGEVHWAESADECWVEIYSEPGWTEQDHLLVE